MTLDALARACGTDKSSACHDYCGFYEGLISHPEAVAHIIEAGVDRGKSLRMWAAWCPTAQVTGIDCLAPIEADWAGMPPRVALVRGDVREPAVWAEAAARGPADLVVDDSAHEPATMLAALQHGWPCVAPGGWLVIEDTCCTYWPEYGNGALFWAAVTRRIDDLHLHGERGHGLDRRRDAVTRRLSTWERTLAEIRIGRSLVGFRKEGN